MLRQTNPGPRGGSRGGRPRQYGPAERGLLQACWELADQICGKRLGPFLPELLERMITARAAGPAALEQAWPELPNHDFSADILAGSEDRLWLHPVPPCGWTDLGTPDRVASVIRDTPTRRVERTRGPLVLATRCTTTSIRARV